LFCSAAAQYGQMSIRADSTQVLALEFRFSSHEARGSGVQVNRGNT
jgi:hypothetical protein